jgi:hypothetical protein
MDLIERYLHAVKFWLPRTQQEDILAELSEDLRSQIEDRETELGRKLDEDEVAAILKKRGQPIIVASGYGPRQSLIGPAWFPAYCFVLKLVLGIMVPVMALIVTPALYFSSPNPNAALLNMLRGLPGAALTTFGIITLIFVCLERFQFHAQSKTVQDWNPRKLPPVPAAPQNPLGRRSVASGELGWGIAMTLAWIYFGWFHPSLDFERLRLSLAPVWRTAFWPILVLLMSGIPTGLVGLLKPARVRLHSSLRLLIDGYTLILIGVVFHAGTWIEIASSKLPVAHVAEIARGCNLGVRIAFIVISIVVIADVLQEAYRIIRASSPRPWTANGLAAS